MIAIGSDHAGFELKQAIKAHLEEREIEYVDFGCFSDESADYAVYAEKVGRAVVGGKFEKGLLFCGTGVGISIAANKVKGVRCALVSDLTSARLTREHNDANVLALGAAITGNIVALEIVDTFIETEFSGLEKHARRIEKIKAQEELF